MIDKDITIIGNGPENTIIDGNNSSRIFNISQGVVSLYGITVQNGSTFGNGGSILNDSEDMLSISNSTISGNSASLGGGIYSGLGSTFSIINSTVSGNSALDGGGIWFNAVANITNSTINGNFAFYQGGGIWYNGEATIINSTVSGNMANLGGGMFNIGNNSTIMNSTISGNEAVIFGGGIYNVSDSLRITGTILAGNTAAESGSDGFMWNDLLYLAVDFSLIGDSTAFRISAGNNNMLGDSINPINAMLDTLADNGGSTRTMALLCGSPAIDAADANDNSLDQRGLEIFNARKDMGAFERAQLCCTLVVNTTDDEGDGSLRCAVKSAFPGDTVTFDPVIDGDTILLATGQIEINNDLTIMGNGALNTFIDGNFNSRIFNITNSNVSIHSLTIQHGYELVDGGGIYNNSSEEQTLTIADANINSNISDGANGGGIYSESGNLVITRSTISSNVASGGFTNPSGGGIYKKSGTCFINNSTITDNDAFFGGGVFNNSDDLYISNSTVIGNSAGFTGHDIFNDAGFTISNTIIGAGYSFTGSY